MPISFNPPFLELLILKTYALSLHWFSHIHTHMCVPYIDLYIHTTHVCVCTYHIHRCLHVYLYPSLLFLVKCDHTGTLSSTLFDSLYISPCDLTHSGLLRSPLVFAARIFLCAENHSLLLVDIFLLSSPLLLQIELQ